MDKANNLIIASTHTLCTRAVVEPYLRLAPTLFVYASNACIVTPSIGQVTHGQFRGDGRTVRTLVFGVCKI